MHPEQWVKAHLVSSVEEHGPTLSARQGAVTQRRQEPLEQWAHGQDEGWRRLVGG